MSSKLFFSTLPAERSVDLSTEKGIPKDRQN